jgi:hypothetical protein
MDNGKTTNEKLRALERWENEGGRVSRSNMEIIGNEERGQQEVMIPQKNERRQNVDLLIGASNPPHVSSCLESHL